jgi:hypothetical protein
VREWLTKVFLHVTVAERAYMSKDKSNNWGEFIRRVRQPYENNKFVDKVIQKTLEEEKENFLFISNGDGIIIKAMHYPDSAFADEDFPIIFKTSEENVLIAAWPQGTIRKFLEIVTDKVPKQDLEKEWEKVMEALSTIAEEKIKSGDINDYF